MGIAHVKSEPFRLECRGGLFVAVGPFEITLSTDEGVAIRLVHAFNTVYAAGQTDENRRILRMLEHEQGCGCGVCVPIERTDVMPDERPREFIGNELRNRPVNDAARAMRGGA